MTTFSTPGPSTVAGGTEKVSRRPSSLRRTPFTSVTRNAVWWIWKLWYWLSVLTTVHAAPADHEDFSVGRPRIFQRAAVRDRAHAHFVDPRRAGEALAQDLAHRLCARRTRSGGHDRRQRPARLGFFPAFVLEWNGAHGVFAGLRADRDRVDPLTGAEEELGQLARPR